MLRMIDGRFPGVVREGVLDRPALAAVVFSDEQARQDLNRITHGQVKAFLEDALDRSGAALAVLDVPLLFESGIDRLCTLTLAVLADEESSLLRIMKRDGISRPQAEARLHSQPDDAFYRARADLVLENRGSLDLFQQSVDSWIEKYIQA